MLKYVKEIHMFQLYHVKHYNLIFIYIIKMINYGKYSQITLEKKTKGQQADSTQKIDIKLIKENLNEY